MKQILLIFIILTFSIMPSFGADFDFDGDGKSDVASFRRVPGPNADTTLYEWYIKRSSDNTLQYQRWGWRLDSNTLDRSTDHMRPADYDGDGKTDIAVTRIFDFGTNQIFYILNSSNNTIRIEPFGRNGDDSTIIEDYDGDGKADLAVYRRDPGNNTGTFIYKGSWNNPQGNATFTRWGTSEMRPYAGDYDGDGKADFCVRAVTGAFHLLRSSDSGTEVINWGVGGDSVHPGDYDGDGKTDFCVRRVTGDSMAWYILERDGGGTGLTPIYWGVVGVDQIFQKAGDFDGDGAADIFIHRRGTPSIWYIRRSSDGAMVTHAWGNSTTNDLPVYAW